ncbi:MAG: hypothetical protein Q4B70_00035 [Lachnospiraceae bacterium]|nr:hypothetical protein [Lachnospiraceae bacterium]
MIFWNKKKEKPPLAARQKTEEELAYEEAKKRIYELHLAEPDLFYVDAGDKSSMDCSSTDKKQGWVYGETAKGEFRIRDKVEVLDNRGLILVSGQIVDIQVEEAVSGKIFKEAEKFTLFLELDPDLDIQLIKKAWLVKKAKDLSGTAV